MHTLIAKIKQKKELQGVADSFIENLLSTYFKKKRLAPPFSEKEEKIIIKDIRAELRLHVGRFQHTTEHISVTERLPHYPVLRQLIEKTGARSILDLGCGRNPLVIAHPLITYYACDVNEAEINEINQYFKEKGIKGKAFVADIRTEVSFPEADLLLLLKVLDIIETKGHKRAEWLLTHIPYRYSIVSFPTRKLSGRRMNRPRRRWIEHILTRHHYTYETIQTDNELFYLISKS